MIARARAAQTGGGSRRKCRVCPERAKVWIVEVLVYIATRIVETWIGKVLVSTGLVAE